MISKTEIEQRMEAAKKTLLHVDAQIEKLKAEFHRQEGIIYDCQYWLEVIEKAGDKKDDGKSD